MKDCVEHAQSTDHIEAMDVRVVLMHTTHSWRRLCLYTPERESRSRPAELKDGVAGAQSLRHGRSYLGRNLHDHPRGPIAAAIGSPRVNRARVRQSCQ